MNKKILAVVMIFVVMITCFAACKRHNYKTTNVNGVDLYLYTDKDGETVINDKNQIIAVVTDEAGEVITYENGEEQTRFVQISGSYVGEGYMQDKKFRMVIPEGWEGTKNAKMYKEGTDNKCYISFIENSSFSVNNPIEKYFTTLDEQDEQLKEGFKTKGYDYDVKKEPATIGKYTGMHYTYKVTDSEGKLIHYAENFYFVKAKTLYSVNYACVDGIGYDETFNFSSYVSENFTFKG